MNALPFPPEALWIGRGIRDGRPLLVKGRLELRALLTRRPAVFLITDALLDSVGAVEGYSVRSRSEIHSVTTLGRID